MREKLLNAATSGDLGELKKLLEQGADANPKDAFGWTALMWAGSMGFPEAVKLLLDAGAEPDARDQYGATALMKASRTGFAEVANIFWMPAPTLMLRTNLAGQL